MIYTKELYRLLMIITAAMTLSLTACSDKNDNEETNPDKPSPTLPTGNQFTVGPTGGTVETGLLKLEIPSGTFTGGADIYVDEVASPEQVNNVAYSKFYKVTSSDNTNKGIALNIKAGHNEDAHMVVLTDGWAPSTGESVRIVTPLTTTFKDGTYTATLPLMHGEEGDKPTLVVGLVDSPQDTGKDTSETKAQASGKRFTINWYYHWSLEDRKIVKTARKYVQEAIDIIESLGFRLPADVIIPIVMEDCNKDWGTSNTSPWGKGFSTVSINERFFKLINTAPQKDIWQLQQTLVHELLHYYTTNSYDPRWSSTIVAKGLLGDEWTILEEAAAVWIEKYTGDRRLGDNCPVNAKYFMMDFFPEQLSFSTSQSYGYGMALAIEYLSRRHGEESIVRLFEIKRDHFSGLTLQGCFERYLDENGDNLLSNTGYNDFAREAMNYKLDERVGLKELPVDEIPIKLTTPDTVRVEKTVNSFGIIVDNLFVLRALVSDGRQLTVKQEERGLSTSVYLIDDKNPGGRLLGSASYGRPFIMKEEMDKVYTNVYLVTGSLSNSGKQKSKLAICINDPEPTLSLDKSELSFSADGGEETIGVTTNQETVKVSTTAEWLDATYDAENKEITIEAKKSDKTEEREAYVVVRVANSAGSVEKTVYVTQAGKKPNVMYLYDRCHVSFDIPLGSTSSCSFTCPTPPQKGTSVVNGNTVVYTSTGSTGDDDKRETWDYSFIIDNETSTITEGHVYYHQVFNIWWGWSYDDPPRHVLATRMEYDVSFNVINLPLYRPNARWDGSSYVDFEDVWMHGFGGGKSYGSGELTKYIKDFSYSSTKEDHMGSSGTYTSTWGMSDIDPTRNWTLNIMLEPTTTNK